MDPVKGKQGVNELTWLGLKKLGDALDQWIFKADPSQHEHISDYLVR